jgi:hypothetical protein
MDDPQDMPQDLQEEQEDAEETVKALEEDPPKDLEDWPDGDAKYKTFGGPEGDSSYAEGATAKLGESGVRHHEDGSVSVDGEKVDNPEDYKGDPIPGGPTDPNATDPEGLKGEPEEKPEGDDDEGDSGDEGDEGGDAA